MKADLLVHNIGVLITPPDVTHPIRGKAMDKIIEIENAYLAVKDGRFLAHGKGQGKAFIDERPRVVDAGGKLVTPGLVDSHTHVVHGGSREFEFEQKMRGVPYLDILKSGGGIHASVKMTREMQDDVLYAQSKKSLDKMLAFGVTTVEGKSGYGLERDTEIKQLTVQKQLDENHPVDIVSTFLGAHALPKAYEGNRDVFLDAIIAILPEVKEKSLAEFVDIFCEDGAFSVEESRRMLEAAQAQGFKLKIHADEVVALGGTPLAAELGAYSADHLMAIDDDGLRALATHDTIANVLPSTSFNLRSEYAPVRTMIERNLAVAISSDYNPGSSPSENYQFALNLAAIHLRLSPNEILTAATHNAAWSIDRADRVGRIAPGLQADFVIFDAPNWPYVLYHFAINHTQDVYKNGRLVIQNQQPIWEGTNHETD